MRYGWIVLFGLLSLSDCGPKRVRAQAPIPEVKMLNDVEGKYFVDGDDAWIVLNRAQDADKAQREVCGKNYICTQEYTGAIVVVKRIHK